MDSTRLNKVARLIQKEMGEYFQHEGHNLTEGGMITVTSVRMAPDLSLAKIYLSIFPPEKRKDAMTAINEMVKTIRLELGSRIRHQIRFIPELAFFIDDSLDYAEKIDQLLKK
jgi:ribosome-binding factor A